MQIDPIAALNHGSYPGPD